MTGHPPLNRQNIHATPPPPCRGVKPEASMQTGHLRRLGLACTPLFRQKKIFTPPRARHGETRRHKVENTAPAAWHQKPTCVSYYSLGAT